MTGPVAKGGHLVAGVDGCPAGWVAAVGRPGDSLWLSVAGSFAELVERHFRVSAWAVDIPIGLVDQASRPCDALARQRLGPQRSASLFSAPPRCVVSPRALGDTALDYTALDYTALDYTALDYTAACDAAEAATGKRLSRQSWNLVPKIRQVRDTLIAKKSLRRRVFESHPELCFARFADGGGLAESKHTPEGISRRTALLSAALGSETVARALAQARETRGVGIDDTLDALACWIAAERFAAGSATKEPADVREDADGLAVAIWW